MSITRSRYLLSKLFRIVKNSRRNCNASAVEVGTLPVCDEDADAEKPFKLKRAIRSYFEHRGLLDVLQQIPSKYLKRDSNATFFLIADPQIARRIGYVICSRLNGEYVLESDPGLGFMSEILVTATSNLRLHETDEYFRIKLEKFRRRNANKVKIIDMNMAQLQQRLSTIRPSTASKKLDYFYTDIPERPWNETIHLSYISTVAQKQVFRKLCRVCIFSENFKQYGRPEYYFLMTDTIYKKLFANPDNAFQDYYRSTAVLFQVVFDFELLLDGMPREAFLPWPRIKKKKLNDDETCVLIRIVPKVNILSEFEDISLKRAFLRFINDNMRKSKAIIPVLESYIPYCGPHFIMDYNLTIYTEFTELSPKQLLDLFLSFSKLTDFYKTDLHLSAVEEDNLNNDVDDDDENT